MSDPQALTSAERQMIATLSRLGEHETLIPEGEAACRAAVGLQRLGIVRSADEAVDGYRLTTRGAAYAEACA